MKIMAVCGSGLGSSFIVEMNIKKTLKKLNLIADIDHANLGSISADCADLFIMAKDIAREAYLPKNKLIVLNNIIDTDELDEKLSQFFEANAHIFDKLSVVYD